MKYLYSLKKFLFLMLLSLGFMRSVLTFPVGEITHVILGEVWGDVGSLNVFSTIMPMLNTPLTVRGPFILNKGWPQIVHSG